MIDHIESLCKKFLWGSKRVLVAWEDVCLPKNEGGLGLRDINVWNQAFLTKQLWDILRGKESLWVKWIHSTYLKSQDFWAWTLGKKESALMRALMKTRNLLLEKFGGKQKCWDKLHVWQGHKGVVTGKVYEDLRLKREPQRVFKVCWKGFIPPKYSFIMWLALRNRLQTKDNLRFLDIDDGCPLCGHGVETANHLFFLCPFSLQVWDVVRVWLGLERRTTSIRCAVKWIKRVSRGTRAHSKANQLAIVCTVYHIWLSRNAKVFDNVTGSVQAIVNTIVKQTVKVMYKLHPTEDT